MTTEQARAAPQLSAIMVSHGAWELTERAVAALFANTSCRLELIVVDNASDEITRARLSGLANAQVIFNDDNRGFGPATNQGAAHAHGRHLVLINTDAFVHPGWIEPLLETVERAEVGAVVPRLLHPDGSLQDAGTLLARDGTVRVYGDGDDPERPCYSFARILDVGSAACIVIRRRVFEKLGGFDEQFAPAYYEDCDLCMRLGQASLSVVYEPRSTVTHVRYGSGRRETAAALSDRNRRLFVKRWGVRLGGRPATFDVAGDQAEIIARDAGAMPRVLICASAACPGAARVAELLLGGVPSARVTWATRGASSERQDRNPWLEYVEQRDPGWLSHRLFLYDLVVLEDPPHPRWEFMLDRTQPQAKRVDAGALEDIAVDEISRLLAAAGIAPARR